MSFLIKNETAGRLNALVKEIGGLDVMNGILDGTLKFTVTVSAHEFLLPAGEVTLPGNADLFNPHHYFQNCKGMYVWDSFTERILAVAQPVEDSAEMTVGSFDIVKSANDAKIRSEFLEDYVFEDPSEFCSVLAGMIDKQSNGEVGNLLNNGSWSIFYVLASGEVYAVSVHRDVYLRKWDVRVSLSADHWRREGDRAFSRTA